MDDDRFRLLFDGYSGRVLRLVSSVLGPGRDADAEEVAQEVFLRVFRSLDRFRGDAALATWIYRIAYNTALNYRRLSPTRASAVPLELLHDVAGTTDLERDVLRAERAGRVVAAVEQLPDLYRTTIYLHYWLGESVEEIALMLGVASGTVKSYLSRARDRVERALEGQLP